VALSEFAAVRPSGLIAISLEEGDVLGWARITLGKQEIIIVSEEGQALRFSSDTVRAMGRQAAGVNAMRLDETDFITSMEVVDDTADLLVVTEKGYGKRTPLTAYTAKGRATGGIMTIDQKNLETTGRIVSARIVKPEDDLTIISVAGLALRTKVVNVRQAGRIPWAPADAAKRGDTAPRWPVSMHCRLKLALCRKRMAEPLNGMARQRGRAIREVEAVAENRTTPHHRKAKF